MKKILKYQYTNDTIKEYHQILCKGEFPDFLNEYINTEPMQRIGKIGCNCGTEYTNIFNHKFFYSNLEHSIGVALIIWNFTHDKKQTLAGLFHDISTPVFKHCIDILNGDYLTQESTEELTTHMILNSPELMGLLNRDEIQINEVDDYHIYPIADNDTPKLSADRLEYTFACGIYFRQYTDSVWDLEDIRQMYENIQVQINEEGIQELSFKTKEMAEKFVSGASKLWPLWISSEDKIVLQFIADTVKEMSKHNLITKQDLYTLSENEVLHKIQNCENTQIASCFKKFREATKVYESDKRVENKYCINIPGKRRYIVPLVVDDNNQVVRINEISNQANKNINNFLEYFPKPYAYLDFNFEV